MNKSLRFNQHVVISKSNDLETPGGDPHIKYMAMIVWKNIKMGVANSKSTPKR